MSKEKLLLVGAGGFERMVAEQAMLQYDCAFVDDGQAVGTEICGIPVIGRVLMICRSCGRCTACWWWASTITDSGHRYMRRRKHLALLFPISLRPVPISVRLLKSAVDVF